MHTQTATGRLRSLLFGAILGCGLLFAGCNADAISGASADEAAVQTDGKTANGIIGDHNSDCSVGDC